MMSGPVREESTQEELERKALPCERCGHCCRFGSGYLTEADMTSIADHLQITPHTLRERYLEEVPLLTKTMYRPRLNREHGRVYGSCVFLDDNRCTIYPVRPVYCRIGTGCKDHADLVWQWFLYHHVAMYSASAWDEYTHLIDAWVRSGKKVLEVTPLVFDSSSSELEGSEGKKNTNTQKAYDKRKTK